MLIGQKEQNLSVLSKDYQNTTFISGDKANAEAVVEGVALHVAKTNDYELKQLARALEMGPITLEKCIVALKIMEVDPTIMVVEDEVNRNPRTGGILIYWEREISLENKATLAFLTGEQIQALQKIDTVGIELLTISQQGFEGLRRYTIRLGEEKERQAYAPTYTTKSITYNTRSSSSNRSKWKYGFCNCCEDCCQCCISCTLFPCQDCKLNAVANGKDSCGCAECCIYLILLCCGIGPCIYRCMTRQAVRTRMNINESCCCDCMSSICCPICAQVQEVRELRDAGLPARFCC